MRPRPSYSVTGVFVDAAGSPLAARCEVELDLGMLFITGIRAGADGRFALDAPAGLDGELTCMGARHIGTHRLAGIAAGTTEELRLVGIEM